MAICPIIVHFSTKRARSMHDVAWRGMWICVRSKDAQKPGRKKAGRWNGQSALGPMCDAEKDWHERSFRASGAINGCQKSPFDKPEMTFSFLIFKLPVTSF